ncbi:hypothetical protein F4818DRAFT_442689 [Hypoxylon cercidicola]|nr:hypothetical protein F4818DRAFT_442689 [Hypoxylon cercidicola]
MIESAEAFVKEVWGLQGTAYLVIGLRYYSRFANLGWRGLSWDDAIMLFSVVSNLRILSSSSTHFNTDGGQLVYTAESVMAHITVAYWLGLANNNMTDAERAVLDPESDEWRLRVNGSKTHVVGLLLYTTLLWLLKACWLVYYARLTDGVANMHRWIRWGIVVLAATYISCLLVAFLKCIPFNQQWQIYPDPGNHCMPAISSLQTIYVMIMNTSTDFYLMAIPLPVVWKSHLPWRKKLVLLVMFSGGLLEMAFGILRCVSILTLGDIDPAQSGYWSVRESFVSVVLTNMPMVYPLFRKFIEKAGSATRSKNASQAEGSRGYRLSSIPGRRQKPSASVPNDTTWGSKDNIVTEREQTLSVSDDTSIELPQHQAAVISFADGDVPGRSRSTGPNDRIIVTKEYTVTEVAPQGSRSFNRSEF